MDEPRKVMSDIEILPSHFPIPGFGFLPVNAFIIKAKEPVLVDTGMGTRGEEFMKDVESIIDPRDLRWIWLTHDDTDHTGNIQKILEAAPNARFLSHSLAALRLSTAWQVPLQRAYWLNPGESINVGDRTLTAIRPPLFDNPTTIGIYDNKSEVFFSADCFGAIIPTPVQNVDDLSEEDLTRGVTTWASVDSPWIYMVETKAFIKTLDKIRQISPKMILSGHLPPAQGKTEKLLTLLGKSPSSAPFVAPNQPVLEQILNQMRIGS